MCLSGAKQGHTTEKRIVAPYFLHEELNCVHMSLKCASNSLSVSEYVLNTYSTYTAIVDLCNDGRFPSFFKVKRFVEVVTV